MAVGSGADWIDGPGVDVGGAATGGVGAGGAGGVGAGGAGGVGADEGGGALAMGVVPPDGVESEALLPPPQPARDRDPQAAVKCHRN